jgi:hypothetical protein
MLNHLQSPNYSVRTDKVNLINSPQIPINEEREIGSDHSLSYDSGSEEPSPVPEPKKKGPHSRKRIGDVSDHLYRNDSLQGKCLRASTHFLKTHIKSLMKKHKNIGAVAFHDFLHHHITVEMSLRLTNKQWRGMIFCN